MHRRAFRKDTLRAVTHSWSRFVALLVIVALGTGFYSGLRTTAPDMRATVDRYYDENRFMDARLVSTFGFTEEDVESIRGTEGVANVMPGYSADALVRMDGQDVATRIHSLPADTSGTNGDYLNRPVVLEGRMPENDGECVLSNPPLSGEGGVQIGDTVTVEEMDGEIGDTFSRRTFTVVGFVRSPYYVSASLGSSTVGSGQLGRYMYVPESDFCVDYYTDLHLTVEGADALDTFSDAYDAHVEPVLDRLETLADERAEIRYGDIRADAQAELDDAEQTYEEEKAKAEQELADAYQELLDGEQEIQENEQKLADGEQELADGRTELDDGWAELADGRAELQDAYNELVDAQAEVDDGRAQLEEGWAEYEAGRQELSDARAAWEEGKAEYDQGLADYEDGLAKYQDGLAAYESEKADAERQLADAERQLNSAQQQIASGRRQLEEQRPAYEQAVAGLPAVQAAVSRMEAAVAAGLITADTPMDVPGYGQISLNGLRALETQMQDGIQEFESAEAKLEQGQRELNSGRAAYESQKQAAEQGFAEAEQELADAKAELDDAKAQPDEAAAEIESGRLELEDGQAELDSGRAELEENQQALDDAQKEIDDGWAQYFDGQKELDAAEQELNSGEEEWAASQQELLDGKAELEDGKRALEEGWQEYEDGKREADEELADAYQQLQDGRDELAKLERPDWYVLGRSANVGFASFDGDAGRMESLSTVFPTVFFLVAALVALTTMTRMVEEERGVIGAYQALGYGRLRIASKYLFYAAVPSILGSVLGILIGNETLPRICWSAYLMMYDAPQLTVVFQPLYNFVGAAASIACTLGATAIACRSSLRETPAALLQPKAPKAGRRILLERITPVWKRLKFTQKVTCRNLFRYRRRLFMTLVGIAGATALLLTGFGIKDSISGIVENQYQGIYRYDTVVSLTGEGLSDGAREVLDGSGFSGWMEAFKESADVTAGDETISAYLFVPEETDRLSQFITLRDRRTKEPVAFGEDSVLLTEKLAHLLGVGVGGTISIENESGRSVSFTVTGITENYVYHYVYISKELYEQEMNEEAEPNEVEAICTADEGQRGQLLAELQRQEGVSTAGFTEEISASFEDLVESLNSIIVVIIICAGALAFVVLYNLTNINVTERERELATIKVLGFRDGEVAGYIYRETTLLMLMGCAIGLVFGIVMHQFVIQTVEVEMVMFGRTVQPLSFVWSALLTILFAVIVDAAMYPKLKRIDMVESLKSVD